MSFFSDLFRGNFSNLGTDLAHAPSSLVNHPDQLAETLGGAALIGGGLFFAPEIGAALGVGGADAAAAVGGGGLAADLGIGDIGGAAAADAALGGGDALAFAPVTADALSIAPEIGGDVLPEGATLDSGALDLGGGASDAAASATPQGFAPTDAELSGATTGTAPASPSSNGLGSMLGNFTGKDFLKYGLAAAPLGLALARGESSLPPQTGPALANATALANQGSNLNASQNASLTQMRQNAINAARQALFNQGVQNPESDTRYSQMVSNIDSQVTAAAQTMIQQNIQNSLQGDAVLMSVAQMQMQADQNFTNTLVNATKALGTAAGLGGGINLKLAA